MMARAAGWPTWRTLAALTFLLLITAGTAFAGGPAIPPKCEPTHTWLSIDRDNFRVWYREDKPDWKSSAEAFADALELEAWPRLTAVMGREPMSDEACDCEVDGEIDGRLDIYITNEDIDGGVVRFATNDCGQPCKGVPTWIDLGAALTYPGGANERMRIFAAHELMHVLQFTYPLAGDCIDLPGSPQEWWAEACAAWAQDHVLGREVQQEHEWAQSYLAEGEYSLHAPRLQVPDAGYRAYLYPFWLTHTQCPDDACLPTVIRETWEALTSTTTAVAAIDDTVAGGWAETFPRFAVANLNQPVLDEYTRWDDLGATVEATSRVLAPDDRYILPEPELYPLASRVYRLEPRAEVRLLQVENGWRGMKDVHLHAVRRPPGSLLERPGPDDDWTARDYVRLCFDVADERVSELYLVASSSATGSPGTSAEPPKAPQVAAWDVPCKRLEGNARYEWTRTMSVLSTTITYHARGEATVAFEAVDTGDPEEVMFRIAEGEVTWEKGSHAFDPQHGLDVKCTAGPVIEPIDPDDGFIVFRLRGAPGVTGPGYAGMGNTTVGPMDYRCQRSGTPVAGERPGSPTATIPHDQASWFDTGGRYFTLAADGSLTETISGTIRDPSGRQEWTSEWHLVPLADP